MGDYAPIASIGIGDYVVAVDPDTGAVHQESVLEVFSGRRGIRPGDVLVEDGDGGVTKVGAVVDRGWVADSEVYNLNVAAVHTFVVAVDGIDVLAHNNSAVCKRPRGFRSGIAKKVLDRSRDSSGVSRCTTCGIQIGGKVKQGKRWFRDWDIDHIYKLRKLKKRGRAARHS
ncbi:hypothetical protein [Micromonospora sp. NPDC050276]|uniref:hypothetical protein n=1 Tax=Micromonospora sp. NPDC050276 TaxID=3364278 RepID=UPI0037BD1F45